MNVVKTNYSGINNNAIIAFVDSVIANLTANIAIFATPAPSVVTLTASRNAYNTAYQKALNGDRLLIMERNEKRMLLEADLSMLAGYVNDVCDGDRVKGEKSGLTLIKIRTSVEVMDTPVNLKQMSYPISGAIKGTSKTVKGANSYIIEIAPDTTPAAPWQQVAVSSRARFIISGLTPGQFYNVRVSCIGAPGQSSWSDPLRCLCA